MANPNTRMNNRKAPDTVGRPHADGHKAEKIPAQAQRSPKDLTAAIEAAEHAGENRPLASDSTGKR